MINVDFKKLLSDNEAKGLFGILNSNGKIDLLSFYTETQFIRVSSNRFDVLFDDDKIVSRRHYVLDDFSNLDAKALYGVLIESLSKAITTCEKIQDEKTKAQLLRASSKAEKEAGSNSNEDLVFTFEEDAKSNENKKKTKTKEKRSVDDYIYPICLVAYENGQRTNEMSVKIKTLCPDIWQVIKEFPNVTVRFFYKQSGKTIDDMIAGLLGKFIK